MQSTETKTIEIKLSHERLISLLNYDAATGVFTWRRGRGPRAPAGRVAGAPVISMSAVYHALRHRGTAALSGGGYRVKLTRRLG